LQFNFPLGQDDDKSDKRHDGHDKHDKFDRFIDKDDEHDDDGDDDTYDNITHDNHDVKPVVECDVCFVDGDGCGVDACVWGCVDGDGACDGVG